jgi:heat shock protein HslJ
MESTSTPLRLVTLLAASCVATVIGSLAGAAAPPTSKLDGTQWTLGALAGRAPLAKPIVTIAFESGRVQGSDGCNRYGIPYRSTGEAFQLTGSGMSTQMACPEPVMAQARAFTDALARVRRTRRDGDQLVMLDDRGAELLRLEPQSLALTDAPWRVTNYNNGRQAVVGLHEGTSLTIEFGADGRISGSAGCNRFNGQYTTQGPNVSIGPLAATRRACAAPPGIMEQEAAFLKALQGNLRARLEGDRLELRTAEDALAVMAERGSSAAPKASS